MNAQPDRMEDTPDRMEDTPGRMEDTPGRMEDTIDATPSRRRRLIAWLTLIAYVGQPLAATAQAMADQAAAAQSRPQVDTTANGLPLVQIAAPSAAGVSHNQYTQFNVDPKGLILNNSPAIVQTQLGGYVNGNPNLAGGSAKIILNEVTGSTPSSLNGYTEVAGSRAEVIVANPNGISCNGCGFINTSRGVLTTGVPVIGGSGSLDAFRVTGGQIAIGAGGMDGTGLDQLDLIARSVKVNGQLWANNLNVVTGTNRVNYADLGVQVIQGDANKPTVGIDVALLGGMYANKIRLVGSEAGVGVNSLGTLAAQAGDFTLDNQGKVTLSGHTSASGNLSISGHDGIANGGTLYSLQNTQLGSAGDITNSGTLGAQGSVALNGANLNSGGVLAAGIDAAGNVTRNAALTLNASGNITDNGLNLAGGDLLLNGASLNLAGSQSSAGGNASLAAATGNIDLSRGLLQATGTATLNAAGTLTNDLGQVSAGQLGITAHDLGNRGGSLVQTGTAATSLNILGQLDNTGGMIQSNSADLSLTPQTLLNDGGAIAHLGLGTLTVATGILSNNRGNIGTNGSATINAASIANVGGKLNAQKQANIASGSNLDNSAGGYIGADSLIVTAAGKIDNTTGSIAANNGIALSGQSLVNTGGSIRDFGAGTLDLSFAQGLVNDATATGSGGFIGGNGRVNIAAASLDNIGSVLYGKGALALQSAGAIVNSGLIQGDTALSLGAASLVNRAGSIVQAGTGATTFTILGLLDNSGGTIQGNGTDLGMSSQSFSNDGGSIAHAGQGLLSIGTGTLSNNGGYIAGNGQASIGAASISNRSGSLSAQKQVSLVIQGALDNSTGGYIGADSLIVTAAGKIDNSTGRIAANNGIALNAQNLANSGGSIQNFGTAALAINLTQALANSAMAGGPGGYIGGNGTLDIVAASLDNSGSVLYGKGALALQSAGAVINRGGLIQSDVDLAIAAAGALDNGNGRIKANGAGSNATLSAASIDNTTGSIVNIGNGVTRISSGTLTNSNATGVANQGIIGGNGYVEINATDLFNTQTAQLIAGGSLALNTSRTLNNGGGKLYAAGNLTMAQAGAAVNNAAGSIGAFGNIGLSAASLDNSGGQIGNVANGGGSIVLLTSGNFLNGNGQVGSDLDLLVSAGTLVGNGRVIAGRDASIALQGNYTNQAGNLVTANRNLSFSTTGNLVNTGTLQSFNNLNLSAANLTNQGTLGAGGWLGVSTGTLSNTGSIVGGSVSITATQKIENVGTSAFIGASNTAGLMELLAPTIQNRDDTTATDTAAQTTIYGLGQVVLAGGKNAAGQYTQAGQVLNQSGLIQSGGDMSVYANTLTNTRRTLQMGSTFTQVSGPVSKTGYWYSSPSTVPGGQPANWLIGGAANSGYMYTAWTESAYQNGVLGISPKAQIVSGGNLNPTVTTLQNYWSNVAAGGNIGLTGVTLDQNSWRGAQAALQRKIYNGAWWYQNYQGFYWTPSGSFSQTVDTLLSTYDSTFTAHGNIAGSGTTIINTAGSSSLALPGMQAASVQSSAGTALGAPQSIGAVASAQGSAALGAAQAGGTAAAVQAPVLSNLALPQGGLFHTNAAPQARYLVETNPAFANRQQWLSSDWYFQHANIDPSLIQKRLGDGFYEQKLVQDQVLSLTGRNVMGNYADAETQFRDMMTAGAQLATDLNITPGIGLSAEQAAKLTDNVIIMETRVVDGQLVLVPVVYLAQLGQDGHLSGGPLIAAANIDLSGSPSFTNSGTIRADNSLIFSGQTLDNRGGNLQSGGLMALGTAGNIDLTSARIKAGSLMLNAGGDLLLNTDTRQGDIHSEFGTRSTTLLGRSAGIDVAGDALISTGGDFWQNGASLNVGGNLQADIGRNWLLGTVQLHDTSRGEAGGLLYATDSTHNVTSQINVGGQASLKSGGSFIAQGAQIDLAGGGAIQAGGELYLGAVKDSVSHDSHFYGDGYNGHNQGYRETVIGTSLTSRGDLVLQSGGDITLQAADVQAQSLTAGAGILGQTVVNPDAKIRIEAVKALTTSTYTESDKGTFWQSSEGHGSTKETLAYTKINLGGDNASPVLQAGGGIVVAAANLAGNSAAKLDDGSNNGGGNNTPTKTVTVNLHDQVQELSKQPGLGYLADLGKRNDVDWQKITLAKDQWDYSHQGLTGAGAALVAIVVAACTAGAGSALVGSTTAGTTSVAGTTLATTVGGATTYTATGAVINAAFTTLVSEATVSLINNQGDLGKTLQDLGSKDSVKNVIASMLTAGVGQAYAGTYNVESFVAKTAAGCAAGAISGAGCDSGATSAGVMAGLAWAGNAMRQDQIASSAQFKGICDSSGKCLTNLSGQSAGVNGDALKLGGGRIDTVAVCQTAPVLCDMKTQTILPDKFNSSGAILLPAGMTLKNGLPLTLDNLIAVLPKSPLGGIQGSTGQLGLFGMTFSYSPGSFADKVVESFAGPHDLLNSSHYYGLDGNISYATGLWGSNLWNTIDVGLAAPFGLSTLCEQYPGICTTIQNASNTKTLPKQSQ